MILFCNFTQISCLGYLLNENGMRSLRRNVQTIVRSNPPGVLCFCYIWVVFGHIFSYAITIQSNVKCHSGSTHETYVSKIVH